MFFRACGVVWEMAFFTVLLGWSCGVGLWLLLRGYFCEKRKGWNVRGEGGVALVRDADINGARLSGKGGCGSHVHSLRGF